MRIARSVLLLATISTGLGLYAPMWRSGCRNSGESSAFQALELTVASASSRQEAKIPISVPPQPSKQKTKRLSKEELLKNIPADLWPIYEELLRWRDV